jgi:hypothetical protein
VSVRADVLLWAHRVVARRTAPAHEILELKPTSSVEDAQEAFHKLARLAHPDLHRNHMAPDELELVTTAYSIAAGAYQTFRGQAMPTQRMKPLKPKDFGAVNAAPLTADAARPAGPTSTPPAGIATAPVDKQMNSRALVYYRKAEIALRRGDFKGAILQIKMAIASDPASAFLRTALAEVELELRKSP